MPATVEQILGQLQKVKRMGEGQWLACCPSHDDRSPSLSIREAEDGRILMHCFGGCDTSAVLMSLGLKFRDVMPAPIPSPDRAGGLRPLPWNPRVVLEALSFKLTLAAILISDSTTRRLNHEEIDELYEISATLDEAVANVQSR